MRVWRVQVPSCAPIFAKICNKTKSTLFLRKVKKWLNHAGFGHFGSKPWSTLVKFFSVTFNSDVKKMKFISTGLEPFPVFMRVWGVRVPVDYLSNFREVRDSNLSNLSLKIPKKSVFMRVWRVRVLHRPLFDVLVDLKNFKLFLPKIEQKNSPPMVRRNN